VLTSRLVRVNGATLQVRGSLPGRESCQAAARVWAL